MYIYVECICFAPSILLVYSGSSLHAVMAEWLRRWTWNPMGSSRAGSNPARSEFFYSVGEQTNVSITDHSLSCIYLYLSPTFPHCKLSGSLKTGPLFPPGLEPGTFRVLGERDNHYTTETRWGT